MTPDEIVAIANHCKANLTLEKVGDGGDPYYQSLPLCVIDTVFSIGANYQSTLNTVKRFCQYFGLRLYSQKHPSPPSEQFKVSEFVKLYTQYTAEEMAEKIYQNKQRTSTRNGILKSQAAMLFGQVLGEYGVEYFQDTERIIGNADFENDIAKIPGHNSGISTRYFYMQVGANNYVKPDRMIMRFIEMAIGRTLNVMESHAAIVQACEILNIDYPNLTPALLDHQIWLYQRVSKDKRRKAPNQGLHADAEKAPRR